MSILIFDLETQKSAEEVGGWRNIHLLRLSVGVTLDLDTNEYRVYFEKDATTLVDDLFRAELVVGFNVIRFDYQVLSFYDRRNFAEIPTLDMLDHIYQRYGFRVSLEKAAQGTLNAGKSANGLMAIEWYKQGQLEKIAEYCKRDVEVTRDLYLYGKEHQQILVPGYRGGIQKLTVEW